MDSFDAELRAAFVDEAKEILAEVEKGLLAIDGAKATEDDWEALARAAHNLKGSARAVGMNAVADLAHAFETELAALEVGKTKSVSQLFRLRAEIEALVDPKKASAIRVSLSRLNELVNTLEDLLSAVDGLRPAEIKKTLRLARDASLSLRMIPVDGLFQRMERIVREVSSTLGKEVELSLEGGTTELDKAILDEIQDPLMHLIHNSLDHGLEAPNDRLKSAKPRAGKISLRAFHRGNKFILECQDDGRGIDTQKVLERAKAKGWVDEGHTPDKKEIYDFLFRPGFSTASVVTAISGRGIGMDVVKATVSRLKGQLEMESDVGKGTLFRLSLPFFIAVVDGWVVASGGQKYVIPFSQVEGVTTAGGSSLKNEKVPVFRLDSLLSESESTVTEEAPAILVRQGAGRASVVVDELIGPQSVISHGFGKELNGLPGISGGALLSDGTLALIMDLEAVLEIRAA